MDIIKLNDTTLKVTEVEEKVISRNYIYEDLIIHRAATVARKESEIAALDAEIAKTDLLIAEFKRLKMDKTTKEVVLKEDILSKDYLLNLASGEIHRLANETATCNIAQIVESESMTLKQALELIEAGKADGCAHCFAEQSKINKS